MEPQSNLFTLGRNLAKENFHGQNPTPPLSLDTSDVSFIETVAFVIIISFSLIKDRADTIHNCHSHIYEHFSTSPYDNLRQL